MIPSIRIKKLSLALDLMGHYAQMTLPPSTIKPNSAALNKGRCHIYIYTYIHTVSFFIFDR